MNKNIKSKFLFIITFLVFFIVLGGYLVKNDSLPNKQFSKKSPMYNFKQLKGDIELGTWLWESIESLSTEQIDDIFRFSSKNNINIIYLRIDDYIDIYESKDKFKLEKFNKNNKRFIEEASKFDVKVQALAGDKTWSQPDYRYITVLLLDYVKQFNLNNKKGFSGLQFDIEPYNMDIYKKDKAGVLNNYLITIDNLLKIYKENILSFGKDFKLGFTIPYWFDNENNNNVSLNWHDKFKPVAYHIFDMLNKYDNCYVVIMSYRNFAKGNDGSIAHAISEIEYADKFTPNVSIMIGQETVKTKIKKISFFNKNKMIFNEEVGELITFFDKYKVFKGVAIHDIWGCMILLK